MKVALFGGSFNPIHNGHLELIDKVLAEKYADEVWIIPCGNHAFDKTLLNAEDRMKMIELAIKGKKKIKIVDLEIKSKGKSYAADTIRELKKNSGNEFYFVIGADNLNDLHKWHDYSYLKENVNFLVLGRPGYEFSVPEGIKAQMIELSNPISSTEIRDKVKKGKSIKGLVPKEVEEYIIEGGIYK